MTKFDDKFEQRATPRLLDRQGETGTYFPASGESKSGLVTVIENASMPDDETGIISQENILICVQRRASNDNPTALIINDPQLGDAFKREGDDDSKRYSFSGEKLNVTADSWELRFFRDIPFIIGGNRQRSR
jgi:hypothetical protein